MIYVTLLHKVKTIKYDYAVNLYNVKARKRQLDNCRTYGSYERYMLTIIQKDKTHNFKNRCKIQIT